MHFYAISELRHVNDISVLLGFSAAQVGSIYQLALRKISEERRSCAYLLCMPATWTYALGIRTTSAQIMFFWEQLLGDIRFFLTLRSP
jgi:hypothetical protein